MSKERYFYCKCGWTIGIKSKRDWVVGKKQVALCPNCKKKGYSSVMEEQFIEEQPVHPLRYNRYKKCWNAEVIYSKEKVEAHKKNMRIVLKECQKYLMNDLRKEFPLGWQGLAEYPTGNALNYDDDYMYFNGDAYVEGKEEIGGLVIKEWNFSPDMVDLYWTGFPLIFCDYGTSLDDATAIAKESLRKYVKKIHTDATESEIYRQSRWWNKLRRWFKK